MLERSISADQLQINISKSLFKTEKSVISDLGYTRLTLFLKRIRKEKISFKSLISTTYFSARTRFSTRSFFYYTLHNGYCVKWKCESASAWSSGNKCTGTYLEQEWTKYEGKWTNRTACVSWRYPHFVQPHWNCCDSTSHGYQACVKQHWPGRIGLKDYTSMSWFSFNCRTELGKTTCQYECKRNTTSEYCNVVPKNEIKSCSSLSQTECGKQSWCTRTSWGSSSSVPPRPPRPPRPWRPKLPPPPPIPRSPFKVVKCIDEQWNERPDAYCTNAGAKPLCDGEWACAIPTQSGTQWCSNPTTKDSTSLCAQKNNIEKCNNTLEVVKHCLSSRRNCASDQYRFAWGPEMAIKATISAEVAKSLKWNPSFNLYFSDLPDEKPFWYELLGACVRGEPKASVSCKSISWRYDSYCSTQRDESSCETVNIYEKKDALSWPITVWLFKHSGQCSVSMYNFNDWEKQDSSSCPSIHKKFFKYVDSCEWGVRKEVVCQSKGSKAILDDSSCDVGSKPDYNMLCWWREFPSMPSTPPTPSTPSTPSTTALYMLYYDPYKWLDEQQLKQCRQSWTCLTNCSIVWSFAKIYDDQYWWGSRKALSTEFFCAHGPQWGAKPYTIKPIYIKGDWRANRYLGTSLSSYSFWLDADHTIPAPDGVYNTNLTSAHASDANESFYEEKVHWMKIINGKIQYNEVIQQK